MSSLLRQSSRLTRVSNSAFRNVARTGLRRAVPLATRLPRRTFATEPPKDDKEKSEQNKDAKSSIENGAAKEGKEESQLREGYVEMLPEEKQALKELIDMMNKAGMPEAQKKNLQDTYEQMSKEGIPKELRELLDKSRAGQMPSVADMAKFARVMKEVRNYSATAKKSESSSTEFRSNDNKAQQKEGEKDEKDEGSWWQNKSEGKPQGDGKGPKVRAFTLDIPSTLVILLGIYFVERVFGNSDQSRDITWQEFRTTFMDKGLVEKLAVINGNRVKVSLHKEATARTYPESPAAKSGFHYYFSIGSVEAFERKLEDAQDELGIPSKERIPVEYKTENSLGAILLSFGPTILIIGGTFFLMRRMGGGAGGGGGPGGVFGMGKSRAKQFNHETDIKVKFKDVAGMDEAKQEIMEFVSFLKTPDRYSRLGAKIPRGAILSGPPGTGKTLLAKATAGESGVPFFSVSGSEFVEMFVGVGPSRVRDLFAMARKTTPCIIFIDEIDAIGKARGKAGGMGGGNDERESTLNQILTEMDGFNTSEQVVVLAGTNRPDVLDKALMRPGRFDRHIAIDRPTMDGRKQIFAVHLKKIVTNEDQEYLQGRLSALTPGFSGADIANCCNEAALIAARTNADSVKMTHFEQAIERVIGGLEKKSLVLNPQEKRVVAYHEAGHAICGWYFEHADPLLKVSIIPRGQGALGYAQYLPSGESYLINEKQLMDRMAMSLGGRVSEELHFDTVTSGASDDFNKVTKMATMMVTQWGMSKKVGMINRDDNQEQRFTKPYAESTAEVIDAEVRRIVDEAYKQCKDMLVAKAKEVEMVAEELLSKEVLSRDDMVRLLGKRPFADNQHFEKYFGGDGGKSAPPPFPSEITDTPKIEGDEPATPPPSV